LDLELLEVAAEQVILAQAEQAQEGNEHLVRLQLLQDFLVLQEQAAEQVEVVLDIEVILLEKQPAAMVAE
jgi:hypothetical protein